MRLLPLCTALGASLSIALIGFVTEAAAETPASDAARARALFREGRDLSFEERFDEARVKFAESEKLDPGAGTLLNLAYCYEKLGKSASAWALYRDAATMALAHGRNDWAEQAYQQADRLTESSPAVVVQVEPQKAIAAIEVSLDGAPVPPTAWGQHLPVSSGGHEVTARAPDTETWVATVEASEESGRVVTVPVLAPLPSPAGSPAIAAPAAPRKKDAVGAADAAVIAPKASPARFSAQKTAAIVLGGTGLAALGTAAVLGISAAVTYKGARCAAGACTPAGNDAIDSAYSQAHLATAGAAIGGVALAGAVTLWLTAPSSERGLRVAPSFERQSVGAAVNGTW
jgi:hypothetical protein